MLRNGRKITKQRPGFAHILKMYLPHNKIMSLLSSLVSETMIGEACCTHNTKRHCIEKITKMNKKRPRLAHFFKHFMGLR